jgi:Flp pilus assembly protein TadD
MGDGDVSEALVSMTGRDLESWTAGWRQSIEGVDRSLPPELTLAEGPVASVEAARGVRLGKLLLARGHEAAAVKVLEVPRQEMPRELQIRYLLAKAYLRMGRADEAFAQVSEAEPPMVPHAGAFAMQGRFLAQRRDRDSAEIASFRALSLNPWDGDVACEALDPTALPPDDDRAALCVAARTWPRN